MQEDARTRRNQPQPANERIGELRRAVDERDETIRLLNEALSQALDELERLDPRRAA